MAEVTGLTAARMLEIEDASIVDGAVSGDNLFLERGDGTLINAGNVRGPAGAAAANAYRNVVERMGYGTNEGANNECMLMHTIQSLPGDGSDHAPRGSMFH